MHPCPYIAAVVHLAKRLPYSMAGTWYIVMGTRTAPITNPGDDIASAPPILRIPHDTGTPEMYPSLWRYMETPSGSTPYKAPMPYL